MNLTIRQLAKEELILLHDAYFQSAEPDAPKQSFAQLTGSQKSEVSRQFDCETHFSIRDKEEVIGFIQYPFCQRSFKRLIF